jgi:hypothetical protein
MPLSSNSIIHLTQSLDALKGIIENSFKIKYCKESINLSESCTDLMIPMVSFCDIPLSEIKDHINKYGNYGIGFTKEWAQRHGLNPVLYLDDNSNLSKSFEIALDSHVMDHDKDFDELEITQQCILDIFRYIKNYQGNLVRKTETKERYRFSDEREWRFVPTAELHADMALSTAYFEDKRNLKNVTKIKSSLDELKLTFEPNDIKYIIIKDDSEISEVLDFLKRVKGKEYSYHDIERLMTRILTTEQIQSDV